jgi:hypothetical protein
VIACKDDFGRFAHGDPAPRLQRLRGFIDDNNVKCWGGAQKFVPAASARGCYNFAPGEHLCYRRHLPLPEFLAQQLQLLHRSVT